jgi:competence protein ComEA
VPDEPFTMPPRPPAPAGGTSALADRFHLLRRDPRVAALLLLAGACAAGVFWFRSGIAQPSAAGPASARAAAPLGASPTTTTTATATPATVVVHVAGAVARPGVVTLAGTSRVIDAIEAAGGAQPDADLDRLNLAAALADGQRIAVPRRGQPAPPLDPSAGAPASTNTNGEPTAQSPLNLNAATGPQLEALPGIGPTLAQAIIEERDRAGGFRSVDDLRRVPGIGDARFAQVQPLVTV